MKESPRIQLDHFHNGTKYPSAPSHTHNLMVFTIIGGFIRAYLDANSTGGSKPVYQRKKNVGEDALTRNLISIFFIFTTLTFILAACASAPLETGILEGHVTIGPLIPAIQQGLPEPTLAPEVYAARQIIIFSKDGATELARVQISADGIYRTELAQGSYLVDINHTGIDFSKGLPTSVEILPNETTRLDVQIDTGIR